MRATFLGPVVVFWAGLNSVCILFVCSLQKRSWIAVPLPNVAMVVCVGVAAWMGWGCSPCGTEQKSGPALALSDLR